MTRTLCCCLALLGALVIGNAVWAQAPATVWHALGIPQAYKHVHDATFNRKGNHPKLERKPPLKKLADPANLKSDIPAIKKAAEIKEQEDLAPQKIKALKYLAQTGCGCYGGVAEALTAALEDCTEEVRYQASLAIVQALSSNCQVCQKTCCTKALAAKMYERAYDQDEEGCYIEPSERVRAVLQQALNDCPPDMRDVAPVAPIDPLTDPGGGVPQLRDAPAAPQPEAPQPEAETSATSRRRTSSGSLLHRPTSSRSFSPADQFDAETFAPPPEVPMVRQEVTGQVVEGKSRRGFVRIMFDHQARPPVGTEVDVYHEYILGTEYAGRLVIAQYEGLYAIAGPRPWDSVKVTRGDFVECVVMVPAPTSAPALPEASAAPSPLPLPPPPTPAAPAADPSPIVEHRIDARLLDILEPPPVVVDPLDDAKEIPVVAVSTQTKAEPAVEREHLAPIVSPPRVIKKR